MDRTKYSRWIAPGSAFVVGSAMAAAVGIGHTWDDALSSEIVIVVISIFYYILTGSKGDVGAIYRRHADERQRDVVMRSSRLAMIAMFAACYVIGLISVATNTNYWVEDVIGSVGGVSFFVGLTLYGIHDDSRRSRGVMSSGALSPTSEDDETPPM